MKLKFIDCSSLNEIFLLQVSSDEVKLTSFSDEALLQLARIDPNTTQLARDDGLIETTKSATHLKPISIKIKPMRLKSKIKPISLQVHKVA
ncbi:unnamed protein product, partial [Dovyalis caffra]